MALGPRLDLRPKVALGQSLVMTPQLQQAIKLLALSNLEVETFIGEALESNPLLEIGERAPGEGLSGETDLADLRRTTLEASPVDQLIGEARGGEDRPLDVDATALDIDRDTGDWGGAVSSYGAQDLPGIDERGTSGPTLAEHLDRQIGLSCATPREAMIARAIVDRLDDAGYLADPLRDLADSLGVPLGAVESALVLVQSFDPTGVGARNLGECLALQAREANRHDPCMARLLDNLDLLARGELPRLKRMCGVDDEDFADMLAELRGYDPKPGLRFASDGGDPVTPDVLVTARPDGGWDVAINQETLPRLIVNRSYYVEMRGACGGRDGGREERGWLSEKLADANWLVKALDQRQKTILKVASEIVKQQEGFFRHGVSQLKPLTLRTVAETIEMHESTVSRVTSNKYLMCPRGTFELKYFFTSGVASADGEGAASAEAVKAAIRQLIDAEDPKAILSDDTLVDLLRAKGFDLARRTVAKYREAIGLGSSVQRRRQKALAGIR
ncbi:MAG: RNA polymerase factor sigma-54 [Novosphingobium sp.]